MPLRSHTYLILKKETTKTNLERLVATSSKSVLYGTGRKKNAAPRKIPCFNYFLLHPTLTRFCHIGNSEAYPNFICQVDDSQLSNGHLAQQQQQHNTSSASSSPSPQQQQQQQQQQQHSASKPKSSSIQVNIFHMPFRKKVIKKKSRLANWPFLFPFPPRLSPQFSRFTTVPFPLFLFSKA